MVDPVAVGVEFVFGEIFVERDGIFFTEGFSFSPSVAFDLETFERFLEGEMAEESMGEFVEEEETKIFVRLEVMNRFFGAEKEFLTGFKD